MNPADSDIDVVDFKGILRNYVNDNIIHESKRANILKSVNTEIVLISFKYLSKFNFTDCVTR